MYVNTSVIFDLIRSSDVDECFDSPCGESVPCVNVEGSYSCECLDGWKGKNCTEGRTIQYQFSKSLTPFDCYRSITDFF